MGDVGFRPINKQALLFMICTGFEEFVDFISGFVYGGHF